jgi:fused signal recognition particle receptor
MFESLRKRLKETIDGFAKREESKGAAPEPKPVKEPEQHEAPRVVGVPAPKPEPVTVKEAPATTKREEPAVAPAKHEKPAVAEKQEQGQGPKINLKFTTKIKKIFVSRMTLSGSEIDGFAESMKESLLRSDVSYSTADEFVRDLKTLLSERQVSSGRIDEEVTGVVRDALMQILDSSAPKAGLDLLVNKCISDGAVPVKILFLGPNGAGKTTTIAKIAYGFKKRGLSAVFAASDTFRAAAIEQLEHHAAKIGIPIIKSKYGADPASVAFDAIAHAKSKGIQLVLIDSAGRQETNKSLISEIEKMVRVCKPDITIFIGESTAGNAIAEQIGEFGRHVRIDGIILTKLDCDAKGGSALSIAKTTGVPVLFFGVGEGYDDLMPYSSEFVVNAILPAS